MEFIGHRISHRCERTIAKHKIQNTLKGKIISRTNHEQLPMINAQQTVLTRSTNDLPSSGS